jgi:hypothetical protein
MSGTTRSQDFMRRGRCVTDREAQFVNFAPDQDAPEAARYVADRFCKTCPVRVECLQWALARNETGVWGGTDDKDREAIHIRRREAATRNTRQAVSA